MTGMSGKILVVGGAGFIGVRVAARLAARGAAARVFDLPSAFDRSGATLQDCVDGDVTDLESLRQAAQGCDGIIHLAGLMTRDCASNPRRAIDVNVAGSLNVFEVARRDRLPVAYLSSSGVFGPDDASFPVPLTLYGVTKLAVEGIARVYAADYLVPSLGLRPYVVYGPGESSGIAAGPSIALAAAVRRQPATIRFSGRVGFVYVDDVARMLADAVTQSMSGASVLTVAGDTRDMEDFVREVGRQSGWSDFTIDGEPLRIPSDLASDPIPPWLGAQPVTPVEEGIARALSELRRNPHPTSSEPQAGTRQPGT